MGSILRVYLLFLWLLFVDEHASSVLFHYLLKTMMISAISGLSDVFYQICTT